MIATPPATSPSSTATTPTRPAAGCRGHPRGRGRACAGWGGRPPGPTAPPGRARRSRTPDRTRPPAGRCPPTPPQGRAGGHGHEEHAGSAGVAGKRSSPCHERRQPGNRLRRRGGGGSRAGRGAGRRPAGAAGPARCARPAGWPRSELAQPAPSGARPPRWRSRPRRGHPGRPNRASAATSACRRRRRGGRGGRGHPAHGPPGRGGSRESPTSTPATSTADQAIRSPARRVASGRRGDGRWRSGPRPG